jgi:hypothetical protein
LIEPRLIPNPDGSIRLESLDPWFVVVLRELPTLMDPDQPEAAHRRLYSHPSDDEEEAKEWERLVHPELFALVATAQEVVSRDLEQLELSEEGGSITIPPKHVNAWISALNVARLTLSAMHDFDEDDMEGRAPADFGERDLARMKVYLMGWLQQMVIEAVHPFPAEEDEEDQSP